MTLSNPLQPPTRILLGPGPSNVHPRVLRALSIPPLGYLDPEFHRIMDGTKRLLQFVFQTRNELTLPISGTGTAGMPQTSPPAPLRRGEGSGSGSLLPPFPRRDCR